MSFPQRLLTPVKTIVSIGAVAYLFYYVAMVMQTVPAEGGAGVNPSAVFSAIAAIAVVCYVIWRHENRKQNAAATENREAAASGSWFGRALRVGLAAAAVVALVLVSPNIATDSPENTAVAEVEYASVEKAMENTAEQTAENTVDAVQAAAFSEQLMETMQVQMKQWNDALQVNLARAVEQATIQSAFADAEQYASQGQFEEAIATLQTLENEVGGQPEIWERLADVKVQYQNHAAALADQEVQSGNFANALSLIENATETAGTSISLAAAEVRAKASYQADFAARSTQQLKAGNYDGATAILEDAKQVFPQWEGMDEMLANIDKEQVYALAMTKLEDALDSASAKAQEAITAVQARAAANAAEKAAKHLALEGKQLVVVENGLEYLTGMGEKPKNRPGTEERHLTNTVNGLALINDPAEDGASASGDEEDIRKEKSKLSF